MAATSRTKPAKRIPSSDRPAEPAPFEPVRIVTKTAEPAEDDSIPLYYLDDVEYRIPKRISQGVTLEFLRLQRTQGASVAVQRILERLLGNAAYETLEQSDDVTDEQLEQICAAVVHHVAGPVEESGKGRAAG
jgi:hypothetical protein